MDAQPRTIGGYRLLEQLGRGGMGVVYRAVHENGQIVALKTVRVAAENQFAGLRREIHALARLRHPGIVRIVEEGVSDGMPWYAMELLEGQTLRRHAQAIGFGAASAGNPQSEAAATQGAEEVRSEWWTRSLDRSGAAGAPLEPAGRDPASGAGLTAGGVRDARDAAAAAPRGALAGKLPHLLSLVRRLCAPLAYLHGEGLVHRDLKFENILIKNSELGIGAATERAPDDAESKIQISKFKIQNSPWPVLVDFGLAAQFGGEVSREALVSASFAAGTVYTMAPEQIRGELVDARADLYALGCILYELLTGQPPFSGKLPALVLWQHLNAEPEPPSKLAPEVPEALEALVLRLLAKRPRERFGHADDVATALGRLGAEEAPGPGSGEAQEAPKPRAYLYRPSFSGRDEAIAELEPHLERIGERGGAVVLVGGPSGIGKTRLLLELARRAERRQFRVSSGECLLVDIAADGAAARSSGALQPFRKTLQAVADLCREKGAEQTERLLGQRGKVLALYEPALQGLPGQVEAQEVASLPAEAARLRLFIALAETLRALAQEQPLLVMLDDLQWADELTLGFLGYLVRTAGSATQPAARVLLIGAYRTEEIGVALRALLEQPGVRQFRLGRLQEQAIGQIVCDMLALEQSPPVFARYLSRQSEGNPFFVAEYLRTAVREGLLGRDEDGRWRVAEPVGARHAAPEATESVYEALPLPQSVRDLVARHLDRLGSTALRLAEAAAVLGKEVEGSLLASLSALGPVEVLEGTQELLRSQVMEDAGGGSLRFVHDKLREVAYERIGELPRIELHRTAAETLETLGPERRDEHLEAMGHHWEHAARPGKARECYLAAARKAKARYAFDQAERLYQGYLRLVSEPTPESIEARNELGTDVLWVQGKTDEARAEHQNALVEAHRLGHRWSEVESFRALGRLLQGQGHIEPALEAYEKALGLARELGDRSQEGRALQGLAQTHSDAGGLEAGRKLFEQALAIYREVGSRRLEGSLLGALASTCNTLGQVEEARALFEQALAIHREVGDRQIEGQTLGSLANADHDEGRIEEARALREQALAIHREVGNRRGEGSVLGALAGSYHDQGRLQEAQGLYRQALAIQREVGNRSGEGLVLGNLAIACFLQGQVEAAGELYEEAISVLHGIGSRYEGFLLGDLADYLRLARNDLGRADTLLRDGEAMLSGVGDKLELGRLLCRRGHLELAGGKSAGEFIDRTGRIAKELNLSPDSYLQGRLIHLRWAQEAVDAGRQERLFRGELIEDLAEGTRHWLVQTGQLPRDLAMLPEGGRPGGEPSA